MPVILRLKTDKGWSYQYKHGGKEVTDSAQLEYIKGLVIPPAYRDVEIYYSARPKILYMGYDAKDRPQFIYASWWADQQRTIKLCNLIPFGEKLPSIMNDIDTVLRKGERWTQNRVVALILRVISHCYFRVGNVKYESKYESHGISTITPEHIEFKDSGAHIKFIGKKAQLNECVVVDPLARKLLEELRDAAKSGDHHLFKYQLGGEWHHVKHTDVNDFLKKYDPVFTSKMFRTFDTNVMLIKLLQTDPNTLTPPARKREVVKALKTVSAVVHNTPTICRKDYADPDLINLYLAKPRSYKKWFITPQASERVRFINFLRDKCPESAIHQPADDE